MAETGCSGCLGGAPFKVAGSSIFVCLDNCWTSEPRRVILAQGYAQVHGFMSVRTEKHLERILNYISNLNLITCSVRKMENSYRKE
jgi:hypothetical protein